MFKFFIIDEIDPAIPHSSWFLRKTLWSNKMFFHGSNLKKKIWFCNIYQEDAM